MLTGLLLMTSLLVVQDAAPATQGASAQPAAAAPSAKPATTPDNVRVFLTDAQSRLYDPQAAGLQSLSFDLPIELPQPVGALGSVHVTWTADGEGEARMTMREGFSLPPGMPFSTEMLEAQGVQQGIQFLGNMLNQHVSNLLDGGVATMGGVQDGLVAVNYDAPGAAEQGVVGQTFLFDEDSVLKRMELKLKTPGPMGGEMDVTMTQSFDWKPAADEKLLISRQSVETDMSIMTQTDEATFEYITVGDIMLLVRVNTVRNLPAMVGGGKQTQVMGVDNLLVNGAAAEVPPPAPAAEPQAPATPPSPHGG